ncbi:MAG TPA: hypothetical protein VEO00_12590 [Actinomycetota bacterium]|nr:hypothetical protein [Actinomycetota bacterium]
MQLFTSGQRGPGTTYQLAFIGAGRFAYTCSNHPSRMDHGRGTYRFRARMRKPAAGRASKYSPPAAITVS